MDVDEWLPGSVQEVQYDENREYSHKNETGEWVKLTAPHVRFKFSLEGYQYPHYSRWMKCSTNEKSNFYSKYLKHLCPTFDCKDKAIDLDKLVGIKVKVMWENNGDYQNVTQIRGLDPKLNIIASGQEIGAEEAAEPASDDAGPDVPF